jgi:hypothetical protein
VVQKPDARVHLVAHARAVEAHLQPPPKRVHGLITGAQTRKGARPVERAGAR